MAPAVVITIDMLPDSSAPGRSTAFLVLTAFLLTFAFIRTSARLIRNPRVTWWPGNDRGTATSTTWVVLPP